jgi:hypothetical protein
MWSPSDETRKGGGALIALCIYRFWFPCNQQGGKGKSKVVPVLFFKLSTTL